jgi:hypothetical protein
MNSSEATDLNCLDPILSNLLDDDVQVNAVGSAPWESNLESYEAAIAEALAMILALRETHLEENESS